LSTLEKVARGKAAKVLAIAFPGVGKVCAVIKGYKDEDRHAAAIQGVVSAAE
ncbi:hypothetical protein KIPB_017334, partial [Kipferlia bialata]